MGVVVVQPVELVAAQLVHKDRLGRDGHQRQRGKAQPVAVLVLAHIHALQLVLDADADLVSLIDARLVGDGHAGLEDDGVVRAQALGPLMHAGDEADAVAGAAAVVDLVRPDRAAGKGVQRKAGAVVQKDGAGHVDVALQHPSVIAALVVGQRADRVGAGDVGCATVILAAVVHQQEAVRLDDAVDLALGVVVHHGGVGTVGGNGREAVLKVAGLLGAALLQHRVDVDLGQGLALGQCLFQIHLEPHHGHAITDVALADVLQFGLVLDALQGEDRVCAGHRLVGGQGLVQGKIGRLFVNKEHFLSGQGVDGVNQFIVAAQRHTALGQCGGIGVRQAARRDKQRAGVHRDQRVGNGQRGAGQVAGAQVQQPAHAVQTGHGQRGGTGLLQRIAHQSDAVGGGRAGLGGGQQVAGGVGQGRALTRGVPDGGGNIEALERGTLFGQRVTVFPSNRGGHAAAVQQQRLTLCKVALQILGHGRHARRACVHALDLAAGQLAVGLHIEAAVTPQGAAVLSHNEGRILPDKAGKPRQSVVMAGQILTAVGVAGHNQHAIGPGCLRGSAQRGDFFIGSQNGSLLFVIDIGVRYIIPRMLQIINR